MRRLVIVISLFIQINLNNAFNDQFVHDRFGIEEYQLDLSNVAFGKICGVNETCIFKCCPEGQVLGRFKSCVPSKIGFSNLTVYSDQLIKTNKSLNSTFRLVPGLIKDSKFIRTSLWWHKNVYLIENGELRVKFPNVYHSWKTITANHFCVEMRMNNTEVKPIFMVEYSIETFKPPSVYKLWVHIILAVCLILTLILYAFIPQLRNRNGVILMIHFSCLTVAAITQACLERNSTMNLRLSSIMTITFFYYFFMVLSICWTNVIFYRLLKSSKTKDEPVSMTSELLKYSAYTFGLSFFLTITVATVEFTDMTDLPSFVTPQIKERGNFRFQEIESIYYFYIPLFLLLSFNWIVCFMKVVEFCKTSRQFGVVSAENSAKENSLNRPMQSVKLLALLTIMVTLDCLSVIYPKTSLALCSLWIGPAIIMIFLWNENVRNFLILRIQEWSLCCNSMLLKK